ncbi:MAG: response regulator [Cytophagales bacterium]|nr:response regulator [Cytophagales bacterium]
MRKISSLVFVLLSLVGFGQELDSLYRELQKNSDDEKVRVEIYAALAWEYRDNHPDSTLIFASRAVGLAQGNNFIDLEMLSTNYLGVAYRNLGMYTKSLEMYLKALSMSEEFNNGEQRGYSLINIANLHLFQKDYLEARNYLINALDQAQELANLKMQSYCYLNLGRVHRELQEYELAEQYFGQAVRVREDINDAYGIVSAELDLAEVLRLKGSLNVSLTKFEDLIPRIIEIDDLRALTRAYNSIAKIHLSLGRFDLGEKNGKEALQIAAKLFLSYDEKEALINLSNIYAAKGEYEEAFEYHVKYANLNYQIFSEEKIRQVEQLKSKAAIEKHEAENDLLREQKERQQLISILFASIAFLFLIAAFVAWRAYILRKRLSKKIQIQKEEIEKDRNLIEAQSEKLRELDEAKSRFFANVSHDLKTPLSLILGNLELVMEDHDSTISPASKKFIETSFKNTKRLVYLTDEINDITRLEAGGIKLKKENVQIVSFIKVLSDMFKSSAEYKGVKLELSTVLTSAEAALIDARQFEKVFYNLVSNAIRHTQKGDKIIISIYKEENSICIDFSDTGEGIHESALPHIFDRFYQSKFNEYRTKEGLGIGLALVKELVELHNGDIVVTSNVGSGTSFIVSLPSTQSEALVQPSVSEFIMAQQETNRGLENDSTALLDISDSNEVKRRILIVDDHPEIRYYIRQILEEQYDVQEATHGLEALEILANQGIDLILTDLMMPWMDGFELIEAIQENEEYRQIPMLIVSARISDNDREKALIKGINNFIQKPFDKKELVLRISNLLERKIAPNLFDDVAARQQLDTVGVEILKKVENYIRDNIDDTNLGIIQLGEAITASERQVYRMIKKVTGKTPYEYITDVRIQYADYLIRKNKVRSASEAARSVGIKNVTTFNKQYQKRFGKKPAELLTK